MTELQLVEHHRAALEDALNKVVKIIGKVRIGSKKQFPYGWRKATKGRTVWRILEELITQNLEKDKDSLGIERVEVAQSEVGVYDFKVVFQGDLKELHLNAKAAVESSSSSKDDISKARGLHKFLTDDSTRELFVATFTIDFNSDMSITVVKCSVIPVAWIPDIYVNPSNNANLQSSQYKDPGKALKRTTSQFIIELNKEIKKADEKRAEKEKKKLKEKKDAKKS